MPSDHMTLEYLSEIFFTTYKLCMGEKYDSLDESTIQILSVYQSLNKYFTKKDTNFKAIHIIDNDGTLGYPVEESKGMIKYGSCVSLPFTHKKMEYLITHIRDPTILAFIATGRRTHCKDTGCVMASIIAKNHNIVEFVDRIWTNSLNGYYPPGWKDEISNEVHKAIMVFLMRVFFPDVNITQSDDQRKALELGFFAWNQGTAFLKSMNIIGKGKFTMMIVNLDNQVPSVELKHQDLSDIDKFSCFQLKQR